MAKISKLSFILYVTLSNYILFLYFGATSLIRNYKNMAYLSPLLLLVIAIPIILLLSNRVNNIDYLERIKKTKFLKYLLAIAFIVDALLSVIISIRVLDHVFFFNSLKHFFLITFFLIIVLISKNSFSVLLSSSTPLFFVGLLLIIIPHFFASSVKDYTLLLPFSLYRKVEPLIIIFFFIADMFSYILLLPTVHNLKSKSLLTISIFFISFLFFLEIIDNILIAGTFFLIDNEFLGFFTLYIQDTISYIGNLGFSYLYLIPVITVFKASIKLQLFRQLLPIKYECLIDIIVFISFIVLAYYILSLKVFSIVTLYMLYFLCTLYTVLVVYFLINRSQKYEISF